MIDFEKKSKIVFLLQFATFCVFAGRAWQHLFWDAPYRELIWDANLMKPIVETFSTMSWKKFATSPLTDDLIQKGTKVIGWIYLTCALFSLFIKKIPPLLSKTIISFGAFLLFILAILYTKEKFYHIAQFLEFAAQISAPIFLLIILYSKKELPQLTFWLKVIIALTFISHGLYAVNYYPRPGYFVQMVISILGVEESSAIMFLNGAGILDFIIGIGIFIPGKIELMALIYAVLWGFSTSIARIWAHFHLDFWQESLHQWTFEAIYRFPHFLLPVIALILISNFTVKRFRIGKITT